MQSSDSEDVPFVGDGIVEALASADGQLEIDTSHVGQGPDVATFLAGRVPRRNVQDHPRGTPSTLSVYCHLILVLCEFVRQCPVG